MRQVAAVNRDLAASAIGAAIYSIALGVTTVAVPLLALDAGYGKAAVGYLIATAAISQMAARMGLGAVMRRYPDWLLVFAAGGFLAVSSIVLAVSSAIASFLTAELLQGVARACFWTGSQTHVVRGDGSSVRRLASLQVASGVGLLSGPVVGGVVGSHSLSLALCVAAAIAGVGMVPPLFLDRLPPFTPPDKGRRRAVWRRAGVDVGCMAGVTAGTWRGVISSYLPVALDHAGQSATGIGALVSVANGASIAGTGLMGRIGDRRAPRSFAAGTLAAGVGTALIGACAAATALEVAVLTLSGLGAGVLQALGPAVAADSVQAHERGDAIAVTGTYRAAAMFASPFGVGASLAVMPLAAAIAIAGGVIALPAVASRRAAVQRLTDGPTFSPYLRDNNRVEGLGDA